MALKDTWVDKKDGVDINSADDINQVAHAVIALEKNGGQGGGGSGKNGVTFVPSVSADGVISWTNDGGLDNPDSVNIKGDKGEQGEQGIQGERGLQGVQGEKGADGAKGDKGDKGDTGASGKDGTSVTVSKVTESTADGGSNVVTFSDNKTITIKNGSKGSKGDKGDKGDTGATGAAGADGKDYVLTETDKTEIADEAAALVDTSGFVAKNQGAANVGKILVVGTDGNLTLTDMPEGGVSGDVIGVLDESNNILLSGNLDDGTYTLKYENADGTYTEIGTLEVGTSEPETPIIENYADPTSADWLVGARYSVSSQAITTTDTPDTTQVTNYIPVKKGDVIRFDSAVYFSNNTYGQFAGDANKNKLLIAKVNNGGSYWSFENNVITILHDDVKFMRFTLINISDKNAVTIKLNETTA